MTRPGRLRKTRMVRKPGDDDSRKFDPLIEELDADMKVNDVVAVLETMRFSAGRGLVSIDRGVRDYLLTLLRRR